MFKLILCEGETDAILISYYLENTLNFRFIKENPVSAPSLNKISRIMNWYKNENEIYLAICPIGGSNFIGTVKEVDRYNKMTSGQTAFNGIILIMDNDDDTVEDNIKMIGNMLDCQKELQAGIWNKFQYVNIYNDNCLCDIACILQPNDEYGALETFVLNVISEDDTDIADAVKQVKEFVDNFKSQKYLRHRREKVKANLAISLDVMYPSKNFTPIDQFLKQQNWKQYQIFQEQFKLLAKLVELAQ